jgi:monofunctional biosynthetic peptidoglycan transglycosylase
MRKVSLILIVALVLFAGFEMLTFPNVAALEKETPETTAFMDIRREQLRDQGKDDALQYQPVSYGKISPYLRRAVLVAEDNSFYEHEGVDVEGMKEALQKDWKKKKLAGGGSTITQQLAKNLYLSPSRNPFRKVKEYFIARSLEDHLTKKRILELYLNVVEMGERVYGAEAAAQHYFNKPASSLTPSEAALLAGCLPNPRMMDPASPNKRLRWRQKMILSRLRRWGYLAEEVVLTEKKPQTTEPPAVDTALQQTPPTDTATPATPPTDTSATIEPATPQSPETSTDTTSTPETTTTVSPPP